ncbi:MAG: copper transporter [Armatimonadota bacterium]
MIDLRYHVYSLAAVFFALAIGVVIGTSFVGKPADRAQVLRISERYEHTLSTMDDRLREQDRNFRAAKADLARSEKMNHALMPVALKDKLLYYNIAIVQTGDYDDLATSLRSVIQSAGGQVTSITKISPKFDFEDKAALADVMGAIGVVPAQNENGRTAVMRLVAEALVSGKHTDKLPILEEKKMLNLSGDYGRWNKGVVIIGGSTSEDNNRAEVIDIPLIDELRGLNAVVVACEPLNAVSSYIPVWKRVDAATVDNADRASGESALICALTGEKAHFGQKRTAERFVPETLGASK